MQTVLNEGNQGIIRWSKFGARKEKSASGSRKFVKGDIHPGKIMLQYCPTDQTIADGFGRDTFESQLTQHIHNLNLFEVNCNSGKMAC